MGQYKAFFGNIKLTELDNIWCYYIFLKCVFWDNTVRKMGHLRTFCRNIMLLWDNIRCFFGNIKLTESDNIWSYYFWDNTVQKWDISRRCVEI